MAETLRICAFAISLNVITCVFVRESERDSAREALILGSLLVQNARLR